MIDPKLCYRKGKKIVIVHVDTSVEPNTPSKEEVVYPSVNAAKRANRVSKFRVVRL